jgi:hypothetical protein
MLPELTRINSIFNDIISLSDVDYINKDVICNQVSKMTGKDNVNIQIQIVNMPKIVEAARSGIEEIEKVDNDIFPYDNKMSLREFKFESMKWYLSKRMKECSDKQRLAQGLSMSKTSIYHTIDRLGLKEIEFGG